MAVASAQEVKHKTNKAAQSHHALHRQFVQSTKDTKGTAKLDLYNQATDTNYAASTTGADLRFAL